MKKTLSPGTTDSSLSIAFAAPLCRQKPSSELTRIIAGMITASRGSCRINDSTEAKIRIMGLLN
ncbi:MAG: hypothetical protein ACLPX5_05645 [Dissulfurispiraceae bacterium]